MLLGFRNLNGLNQSATVEDTLAGSGGGLPLLLGSGVSGITESVSTQTSYVRTAADSVASIAESAVRLQASNRTIDDSVSAISEAVVGIKTGGSQNYTATVGDSLAGAGGFPLLLGSGSGTGISEGVTTQGGLGRSVSETLGSISEAVVGVVTPSGPQNLVRSVADSIAAISEAVAIPSTDVLEPAGAITLRYIPDEPRHLNRVTSDAVPFIDERIDDELTESDEWLVLDMPELVLA